LYTVYIVQPAAKYQSCTYTNMLRLVAKWAEFQHSVVSTVRLISVEKDWNHVLTQNVVTLNTCCDVVCLTFQLPHITIHNWFCSELPITIHNWLSSEPSTHERTQKNL